jgi:hypothetical protein
MTTAALSYFLSLKVQWGATVKEVENPTIRTVRPLDPLVQ